MEENEELNNSLCDIDIICFKGGGATLYQVGSSFMFFKQLSQGPISLSSRQFEERIYRDIISDVGTPLSGSLAQDDDGCTLIYRQ